LGGKTVEGKKFRSVKGIPPASRRKSLKFQEALVNRSGAPKGMKLVVGMEVAISGGMRR